MSFLLAVKFFTDVRAPPVFVKMHGTFEPYSIESDILEKFIVTITINVKLHDN